MVSYAYQDVPFPLIMAAADWCFCYGLPLAIILCIVFFTLKGCTTRAGAKLADYIFTKTEHVQSPEARDKEYLINVFRERVRALETEKAALEARCNVLNSRLPAVERMEFLEVELRDLRNRLAAAERKCATKERVIQARERTLTAHGIQHFETTPFRGALHCARCDFLRNRDRNPEATCANCAQDSGGAGTGTTPERPGQTFAKGPQPSTRTADQIRAFRCQVQLELTEKTTDAFRELLRVEKASPTGTKPVLLVRLMNIYEARGDFAAGFIQTP